eukprot:11638-Heterococcus_DN1.PRE.4
MQHKWRVTVHTASAAVAHYTQLAYCTAVCAHRQLGPIALYKQLQAVVLPLHWGSFGGASSHTVTHCTVPAANQSVAAVYAERLWQQCWVLVGVGVAITSVIGAMFATQALRSGAERHTGMINRLRRHAALSAAIEVVAALAVCYSSSGSSLSSSSSSSGNTRSSGQQ